MAPKTIKIVMADDEANILNIAGGMLRDFGYEVITACDGQEAFEKALVEKPDLIILDRNMPRMDGIEACRKIRDTSDLKGIPVIFLTAREEEKEIFEGLREGANDYITKPFNLTELKERIEKILKKTCS